MICKPLKIFESSCELFGSVTPLRVTPLPLYDIVFKNFRPFDPPPSFMAKLRELFFLRLCRVAVIGFRDDFRSHSGTLALKTKDFSKKMRRFSKTQNSGLWKRCFWKTVFLPPTPKTGGFDEKWRKFRFTFYPQKPGVALLRARKPTKMMKMAGVPQTKPGFAKNRIFATLKNGFTKTIPWTENSGKIRGRAF